MPPLPQRPNDLQNTPPSNVTPGSETASRAGSIPDTSGQPLSLSPENGPEDQPQRRIGAESRVVRLLIPKPTPHGAFSIPRMSDSAFHYVDGVLHVEGVSAASLAEQFGTPLYVYSRDALTRAYRAYADACAGRRATVHVAVKANSNLAVLNVFARMGAGFDIVSSGELARVLAAGGKAENTVFSGVGKSAAEMREALEAGVKCFNVESIPELHALNEVAAVARQDSAGFACA